MTHVRPIVAAFDFDGTITTRDTFVPYLDRAFGFWPVRAVFVALAGEAAQVALHRSNRDRFKARLIARLFAGQPVAQLQQFGMQHARAIESWVRPAALERIDWHRRRGHRLVMVSASLDLYLTPIAQRLGFDDLLCTCPSHDQERFDGGMNGDNCRGPEKVRRLEALLGERTDYQLYAYGDSAGDHELLAAADFPHYRPFE